MRVSINPRPVRSQNTDPGGNGQEYVSQATLTELLSTHDVVSVADNSQYGHTIIVTEKGGANRYLSDLEAPVFNELGASGTSWRRLLGGEEYNSKLSGKSGLQLYDRMRRSDAAIRSSLLIAKTPVMGANWAIMAQNPDDAREAEAAEFITDALYNMMTSSWHQFLWEALKCLDFGYYFFEKVFHYTEWRGRRMVAWRKFAPRHPLDVNEWNYDRHGGPVSVEMDSWEGVDNVVIAINRLLVFTYDLEAGNIEGIALLRSAYKHWFMKENLYKIDAIQKERHGIGVPVIKLPPGFKEKDRLLAEELGRNLRTNEKAHVVLPPGWDLVFVKVEGNPVNPIESIEHHDMQIFSNVLAKWQIKGGNVSRESEVDLYQKATRFIADILADIINKHAIPELVRFNYGTDVAPPVLRARRIGETRDWRTLSFALRNMIGAHVVQPDEELEKYWRAEMDLPPKDTSTERDFPDIAKARVGGPRQGAPSAAQGQGTGEDRSGSSEQR